MENAMPVALGALETQLLAYSQMRSRPALRSEEVAEALGLTPAQTRELLSRLSRRNLIARVRRGLLSRATAPSSRREMESQRVPSAGNPHPGPRGNVLDLRPLGLSAVRLR